MNFFHIKCKYSMISSSECCTWVNTCCQLSSLNIEVQEYFCSKQLVNFDCRLNYAVRRVTDKCL